MELADKRLFAIEQVDLVLGGDVYIQVKLEVIRKDVLGSLLAQEIVFGWILTGRADGRKSSTSCVSFYNEVALDKQLKAFWESEDIPRGQNKIIEDERCENIYTSTMARTD